MMILIHIMRAQIGYEVWARKASNCSLTSMLRKGLAPPLLLMNKPLKCDVPALSSPSATSIYPLLWEMAPRNDRHIPRRRESESTALPLLVKMNYKPKTYTVAQRILLLAERPCLPFSPGVLCSHCLTEWLIWLNFTLQTSQVHIHSLSVQSAPEHSREAAWSGMRYVLQLIAFRKNTGHKNLFHTKT